MLIHQSKTVPNTEHFSLNSCGVPRVPSLRPGGLGQSRFSRSSLCLLTFTPKASPASSPSLLPPPSLLPSTSWLLSRACKATVPHTRTPVLAHRSPQSTSFL